MLKQCEAFRSSWRLPWDLQVNVKLDNEKLNLILCQQNWLGSNAGTITIKFK
jgi:hypothetical protein